MRLTISQRDKLDQPYSSFVRAVGEDRVPRDALPDGADLIPLGNDHEVHESDRFHLQYTSDFEELIDFVYPDLDADHILLETRGGDTFAAAR